MLKKVVHCTVLDLSQYLPFKFHYVQRLPPQEVPKISMEIDYLGDCRAQRSLLPSGSWHPYSVGQHSNCSGSL